MLNKKQEEIVNTKEEKVVVMSSAASGKTRILTERTKFLLRSGVTPEKIVVITFTNAAADEMRERLSKEIDIDGLFIGTIHSYANFLLLSYGISTSTIISDEQFDKLFHLIERNLQCIREVDYLLLDEAQDSDELQFKFILEMINPTSFFIVGDIRQSIYSFRGGRPDLFNKLATRRDVKMYTLNENYRNGADILSFAKRIISKLGPVYVDTSIPRSGYNGNVVETGYDLDIVKTLTDRDGNYGTWFVLTRTNAQLTEAYRELTRKKIPCDTFKRAELSNAQLNQKMKDNTVKVLTIHTAKGLEADNVVVIGAKFYNDEEKRVAYVAATRAKCLLIWMKQKSKKTAKANIVNWN